MIELRDIRLSFGQRTLIDSASATLRCGTITALLGRNGTGKSTLLRAMASLGDVQRGDLVLVHGAGPIGLIVADVAKSKGAKVIISELNEKRLEMAKAFGLDYPVNPIKQDLDQFISDLTEGEGVNVIFDAAGVPAIIAHAVGQLSPAGRFVPMTFGKEPIPVDFKTVNAKQLTILGTRHQYQKFPEIVELLSQKLDHVDMLTTHIFPAEEYKKAFDTLADPGSGACKVVLTFA